MSYPFPLRFLVGRLLIDNALEERACIVSEDRLKNQEESEGEAEGEEDNQGSNEIWTNDELDLNFKDAIGVVEFRIGASPSTYEPEFIIEREAKYGWHGREGIKDLFIELDRFDKLDRSRLPKQALYYFYFILGSKPPPGVISGLTKRFGHNLLEQADPGDKRLFWGILLTAKKNQRERNSNINKSNQKNMFMQENAYETSSFHDRSNDMPIKLGESFSTNCAEIEFTF